MMPPFPASSITGEPYSAEEKSEHSQVLADGTHINQDSKSIRMFRDSQGRTRTERSMFLGLARPATEGAQLIDIRDPVAGYWYTLDVPRKIAHRRKLPHSKLGQTLGAPRGLDSSSTPEVGTGSSTDTRSLHRTRPATGESRPQIVSESLGTEMIEGVLSQGTRTTMTIPVGWEGNDRPMARTCERWLSAELKLMMRSACSDPRIGDTATRVTNLDRTEPDPALFQVPPGYKIVNDKGAMPMAFSTGH
jgi:hypothetical protein